MDVLQLRYLIREAIEDTIKQQSIFKIGQKVTTADGDTATITMVEHPFYTVEIESTGTTKSYQFKELAPFVEKEVEPQNEGFLIKENINVSPGLDFHQKNKLTLLECVYRIGSEAYIDFYAEAKKLLNEGKIVVNELDKEVLKTDIGEYGIFEGQKVALDLPMVNEEMDPKEMKPATYAGRAVVVHMHGPETEWKVEFVDSGKFVDYADVIANLKFDDDTRPTDYMQRRAAEKDYLEEKKKAKKKKKDPPIGKPKRGGSKAYYVYVRDKGKIKKVSFGSGGLRAKINNPKARRAFAARHKCSQKNDRTKASYWSCRLPRYAKALGLGANKNTFW